MEIGTHAQFCMLRKMSYMTTLANLKMALKKANILQHTKSFLSDTPQSIKRQNKGPKEHDENIYPVVDRNRPIRKSQAQDRYC